MQTLQDHRTALIATLDAYQREVEWSCACLACGHAPAGGHQALQALYREHADRRAEPGLYPLVCAHWETLNAAYALAGTHRADQRHAATQRLREARAWHRIQVQALRQAWTR